MAMSSLITVLALIASVSAMPYNLYGYGTLPAYAPRAAYTAAELYNPAAVPLPAAYPAGYPAAYSAAYSAGYPYAAPLTAPVPLPAAYGSSYSVEELAALPVPPLASVAPVAPTYLPTYGSPYSYLYKR